MSSGIRCPVRNALRPSQGALVVVYSALDALFRFEEGFGARLEADAGNVRIIADSVVPGAKRIEATVVA